MTDVAFNLDRELNVKNNMDALAKKWTIQKVRGRSLFWVRPEPYREDAVIPKNLQGQWTKESYLQEQIDRYLKESWDKAEAATAKTERARVATKEAEANSKKVAKKAS